MIPIWKEVSLATQQRVQLLEITDLVQQQVAASGIKDGLCLLFVPHTTAALTINENADPDVVRDLCVSLERLVPRQGDYHHGEGNSDAHLKATLLGASAQLPVQAGRLALGTWQGIYFCEFDGPRQRKLKIGCLTNPA